ncbi:MAG: hypothetical protein D6806_01690 [Deltaproteobacteria bacterium]|nr:MAG: hypothetical protein D6806_01690 [Deltaproteobacteria bacterium]
MKRLRVVQSLFEAQRCEALLKEEGIDCVVQSYADTALDGLYQAQKGWGEIRVDAGDVQKGRSILDEHLPETTGLTDEEIEKQAIGQPEPEDTPQGGKTALWILGVILVLAVFAVLWGIFGA